MSLVWIVVGLVALIAFLLWQDRREKREKIEAQANRQRLIDLAQLENRLALLNPRLARGEKLSPGEQTWIEEMIRAHRITSDPERWARSDLGYDGITGTTLELLSVQFKANGSAEKMKAEEEQMRVAGALRMAVDIGMPIYEEEMNNWMKRPESRQQIDDWWASHHGQIKREDPVLPGQRIYHADMVSEPLFQVTYSYAGAT